MSGFPYDVIAPPSVTSAETGGSPFRFVWKRAMSIVSLFLSCSVEMRRYCLFLCVVISALQLESAGENPVLQVHGTVGGSVYMRCELDYPPNVNNLYFQRTLKNGTEIFINGFHSKDLNVSPKYKNRTIINKEERSMTMLHLSPADEGDYTCIPFHNSEKLTQTKFNLTVTANYSVPNITVQGCGSGQAAQNCVIGCSSSGGFPLSRVTWGVTGNETSRLQMKEDTVSVEDPLSQLWTVSQTVTLNCSQMLNITCTVGGVVSPAVSVCPPSDPPDFTTLIACAVLMLVSIVVLVTVVIKCRRTQPTVEPSTDAELASLK